MSSSIVSDCPFVEYFVKYSKEYNDNIKIILERMIQYYIYLNTKTGFDGINLIKYTNAFYQKNMLKLCYLLL